MKLDEKILQTIEQTLNTRLDKEEPMRSIFQLPRHVAQSETSELLAEFRSRRSMGNLAQDIGGFIGTVG